MFRDVPECSGMFRNVPECSMFRVLSTARTQRKYKRNHFSDNINPLSGVWGKVGSLLDSQTVTTILVVFCFAAQCP